MFASPAQPCTPPAVKRVTPRQLALQPLWLALLAGLALLPGITRAGGSPDVHVVSTTPASHEATPQAEDSAATELDVHALVAQFSQSAGAAALSSARGQITVRNGETLVQIVRRSYPQTPLKEEVIRIAFERLNPGVTTAGRYRGLPAGTRLTIPNPEDIRQVILTRYPESAGLLIASPPKAGAKAAPEVPASPGSGSDRPRWVRFPG